MSARVLSLVCLSLATGCITININFPAREVEKAAEKIVGEARPWGEGEEEGAAKPGEGTGDGDALSGEQSMEERALPANEVGWSGGSTLLSAALSLVPLSLGAGEPDRIPGDIEINIQTAKIRAIRASLVGRSKKLKEYYIRLNIGESREGYLVIRDDKSLSLKKKRDLKMLVEAENKDRKNLYLEILRENKFDQGRLKDVQMIFAAQWQKKSLTGWWIQTGKGQWIKKPHPGEKKK